MSNKTTKFIIQTYSQLKNEIQIYNFTYTETSGEWIDKMFKVNLNEHGIASHPRQSKLKLNFGFTYLHNYIILFTNDGYLTLINYEENKIIYHKILEKLVNISLESIILIKEIECTDDFIIIQKEKCLANLNHGSLSALKTTGPAVYVEVQHDDFYKIMLYTWTVQGDSYDCQKNIFCSQHNKYQHFKFYDLNLCKEHKSFIQNHYIKINFNDTLLVYGFSPDSKYFYTFENESVFSLFSLTDSMRIAYTAIHYPVYKFNITDEYVTFILDNGKIFSNFIIDQADETYLHKAQTMIDLK